MFRFGSGKGGRHEINMTEGPLLPKILAFSGPLIHAPFTHGQLGVLMPKGSEDLLEYVNAFLRAEKESGRIDELAGKYVYLEEPAKPEVPADAA